MRWTWRVVCLLLGHDWEVLRVNQRKHINLCNLHPMAGMDAECHRCGYIWMDADDSYFQRGRT